MTRYFAFFPAVLFTLSALSASAWGEQPNHVPVVGVLGTSVGPNDPLITTLRHSLRQLGYIEGENIRYEFRSAQSRPERLPGLAEELVQLKVDVILAANEVSIRAVKKATNTIPIVMAAYDLDPVESGLIPSLGQSSGNITGIFTREPELVSKRLEMLKEVAPKLSGVTVFWDSFGRAQLAELKPTADKLGIKLDLLELQVPYDFPGAFKTAKKHATGAVFLAYSPVFYVQAEPIAAQALKNRLAAVSQFHEVTRAGGLMSYGTDTHEPFERAAYFIDRLLKGASPSDLPVERSATFKLVLNLRTARALGLTFPQSILLRADEVIR